MATLHTSHMVKCLDNINDSSKNHKLRTFKLFKEEFKFETYLMLTKNLKYTLSLFRFRISSHNLRIKIGRYTRPKTPENEWVCLYYTTQAVENESHFTLNCNLYSHEREELFNIVCKYVPNFIQLTNEEKFVTLMSSKIKDFNANHKLLTNKNIPTFYTDIHHLYMKFFKTEPENINEILNQSLWLNSSISVNNNYIYVKNC